jgi:hypothetical protein
VPSGTSPLNEAGVRAGNGLVLISPPGAPPAPQSVSAIPGDATATVSWLAPKNTPMPTTGYEVTPVLAGVAQTPTTFQSTATSEVVSGLNNGGSYTFEVAATNSTGTSTHSPPSSAIIVGAPTVARAPSAEPRDGSAIARWKAPVTSNGAQITGYAITPYLASRAQPRQRFNNAKTSQTISGLTNGKRYSFRVAAINSRGTGVASTNTPAITIGTPLKPIHVTATASTRSATVEWDPPVTDNGSPIQSYSVTTYRGDAVEVRTTVKASVRVLAVTGLTSGQTYGFTVAASNSRGLGAASPMTPPIKPT